MDIRKKKKTGTTVQLDRVEDGELRRAVIVSDFKELDDFENRVFSVSKEADRIVLKSIDSVRRRTGKNKLALASVVELDEEGVVQRFIFESGAFSEAEMDDGAYSLKRKGERLILRRAVSDTKVVDVGKVTQSVNLTLDDKGQIEAVTVPAERLHPQKNGRLYRSFAKTDKISIRSLDVPSYYLAGVEKKMDLLGSWNKPFVDAATRVREDGATLLDFDRLYTLWQCVGNVAKFNAPIVEVGVLRGGGTALIAEAARHFGKSGTIYACDTFAGHVEVDDDLDGRHQIGTFGERTSASLVQEYLAEYSQVQLLVGDVKERFPSVREDSLAFVHLDVDVFQTTKYVLEEIEGRMVVGGQVVIDDYGVETCLGVKKAVDDFVVESKRFCFTHLLTGQALLTCVG